MSSFLSGPQKPLLNNQGNNEWSDDWSGSKSKAPESTQVNKPADGWDSWVGDGPSPQSTHSDETWSNDWSSSDSANKSKIQVMKPTGGAQSLIDLEGSTTQSTTRAKTTTNGDSWNKEWQAKPKTNQEEEDIWNSLNS